ncbi:MAG: hypothetical protein J6M07_07975, partial [Ruminococcus sp.]|nr:hypothetical protein [Ruminococcus sp.]
DNSRMYRVGDTYPRAGLEPSEERIDMLSTTNNPCKQAFIEIVKEGDSGNGSGGLCNSSGNTVTDESADNAGARKSRKSPANRKRKAKDSSK